MTTVLTDPMPSPADGPAPEPEGDKVIQARTPLQLAWLRFKKDKVALGAAIVILLLVLIALPPVNRFLIDLVGHPPDLQYRDTGLEVDGLPVGPGTGGKDGTFLLGTDGLGRDVLSRLIHGSQISLIIGIVATGVALIIGVLVGLFAGYYGGKVDTVLSRVMDIILSFPQLLFAIAIIAVLDRRSVAILIFVIAFFGWVYIARIVRGQVLSLREKEFIEAARSLGASDMRIIFTDVLPNLVAPIIVYTTLVIPQNILTEASLSFLGLGVELPRATWGNMLFEAVSYYQFAWWFFTFPGLALLTTVLAFNLLGDGLRDALDPRAERTMAK